MEQTKLYVYSKQEGQQTVSYLPPTRYKYSQPFTRLVSEEGYFLSDGEKIYNTIDVPNSEIIYWQELKKEDYKFLFKDEFPDTEDESFSK